MTEKVVQLKNEPVMICSCGCSSWYLICQPDPGIVPTRLIAFECARCGLRVECNVVLEGEMP